METLLRQDLESLGISAEDIDHIEIAVECAREARCLSKLAELQVRRQEMQAFGPALVIGTKGRPTLIAVLAPLAGKAQACPQPDPEYNWQMLRAR